VITFQRLHDGTEPGQIVVGAYAGDEMIGAAIADVRSTSKVCKLESVFVGAPHRGRGIAEGLVRALERHARSHGSIRLEALYSGTASSAPTVAHVLAKAGWTVPRGSTLILDGSIRISEARWVKTVASGEYEIFGWSDLTMHEAADLALEPGTSPWYPPALGPFPEQPVEAACSVGVRHRGRVVGWMLTHRVDPARLRYSRLFVRREHRARFSGIALVAEAIRRQHAAGIPNCLCAVASENAAMMRVVRRRLQPYIESKTELCCALKDLASVDA
jgi:GNAT superfamily N-acetyltransferase